MLVKIMIFFRSSIFLLAYLFSQSGYEIAEKMSLKPYPKDVTAKLIMTLEDKRGNQMESTIKSYTKDNGKKQIMWFLSPPADRGISLYKIEKSNKDEMKMWLPAFKKIRKISSRKKTEKFMNSDLTFEDLYNREIDDYTYELIFSEDSTYYILTSTPNKDIESSYSKHISWIDISSLLISKEESYGKSGVLVKTKEFDFIDIDNYSMVKQLSVTDKKTKHKTYLRFEDMKLNSGIKDSEFHEMKLRRIPVND